MADAGELIRLAAARGKVLQVGHIERFSAVGRPLAALIDRPLFIQATRVGNFAPRGEAVSAVLDLMIHDLDLILSLVKSPIEWAHAVGAPVITAADDMASCRIQFENGCVADLTVSRVSLRNERKMRIFQRDSCTAVDFIKRRIGVFRHDGAAPAGTPALSGTIELGTSLLLEWLQMNDTYTRVLVVLRDRATAYRLIGHVPEGRAERVSTLRGHTIAAAANCLMLIVKLGKKTTRFVLAIVPGDRRVDIEKVRASFPGATYTGDRCRGSGRAGASRVILQRCSP